MEEAGISYLLLTSAQSEHLQTAPEFLTYVAENAVPTTHSLPPPLLRNARCSKRTHGHPLKSNISQLS